MRKTKIKKRHLLTKATDLYTTADETIMYDYAGILKSSINKTNKFNKFGFSLANQSYIFH